MNRQDMKVFISHAHEDLAFVRPLMQALEARGVSIWSDVTELKPGILWKDKIESAMNVASVFILIISPAFMKSEFAMLEMGFALSRSASGAILIPIIARDTVVPPILRPFHHLDGRTLNPVQIAGEIALLIEKAVERQAQKKGVHEKKSTVPLRIMRIFVSSPGDVFLERECVSRVAEEINKSIAEESGIALEVTRWESMPVLPQHTSQETLILSTVEADVFVAILHARFGTILPTGISGTEEEFRAAYESWKRLGHPQVLIYFKTTPISITSLDQLEQMRRVLEFRKSIKDELPYYDFSSTDEFEIQLRRHLIQIVSLVKATR
jgi:hypothetical protein